MTPTTRIFDTFFAPDTSRTVVIKEQIGRKSRVLLATNVIVERYGLNARQYVLSRVGKRPSGLHETDVWIRYEKRYGFE